MGGHEFGLGGTSSILGSEAFDLREGTTLVVPLALPFPWVLAPAASVSAEPLRQHFRRIVNRAQRHPHLDVFPRRVFLNFQSTPDLGN